MEQIQISLDDLRDVTSRRGWNETIVPFWEKQIAKFKNQLELILKKSSQLSEMKYQQGFLDGYVAATKVAETIRLGQRLKIARMEKSPSQALIGE